MSNITETPNLTSVGAPISASTNRPIAIIETHEATFIIVFMARHIQAILTVIGNGMVLLAFKLYPDLRNATGWLICGLALSDLIGSILSPIMVTLSFKRNSAAWVYLCHFKLVAMVAYVLGNIIFTAIIACERFITLSYPLTYQNIITSNRASAVVSIVWTYIAMYTLAVPFQIHEHLKTVEQVDCLTWSCFTAQVQLTFLVQVYICTILTFIVYGLIVRIAWKKAHQGSTTREAEHVIARAQWKITKMMGTVALVYGAFYVPVMIVDRVMRMYPHAKWITEMYFYFSATFIVNSWVNPILYVSKNPQFKSAVKKMLPVCIAKRLLSKVEII